MNIIDYTYLINKPEAVNEKQSDALEKVLLEFPYFQSARALQLKGLYNQNSFKYNFALKVTAAHTTDRTVLFDFITSNTFVAVQKGLYDKKVQELLNIGVIDHEIIRSELSIEPKINTLEQSILTSIKEATVIDEETKLANEKLNIGAPLDFSRNEKHSFQEWLQLSRIQPINRGETEIKNVPENTILDLEKKKKAELIDKFIESSPKIPPLRPTDTTVVHLESSQSDEAYLMTETLARVYLEQKKYQRAIQAYEILILKYPEKSSFFADRISDIAILQQNNT
jgi:tetratricopeptide (TPR) repeat protein